MPAFLLGCDRLLALNQVAAEWTIHNLDDSKGASVSLEIPQYLEQHAQRRSRGIPTLSVLVGDGVAAYRLWLEQDPNRILVSWSTQSRLPLFETWLSVLIDRCGICESIFRFLARESNEDLTTIRQRVAGHTDHSFDVYWQSLALPKSAEWIKHLFWQTRERQGRGMELAPQVASWLARYHDRTPCLFNSLLVLYEPWELPGLWIATHALGGRSSQGELSRQIVPLLTPLCESIPSLPIAVSVSPETMNAYLLHDPESHAKALFREGRIDVGVGETTPFVTIRTASEIVKAVQEQADDVARSKSERFLIAQLEARPQTAGVFILNPKSEYRFGSRRLEIDLFSETHKIAIELDGFHHFHDPEAYRRDRKKDLLLQKLGIFVLRFLSDDVVNNLEQILATIDDTIKLQRSRLHGQDNRVFANEAG